MVSTDLYLVYIYVTFLDHFWAKTNCYENSLKLNKHNSDRLFLSIADGGDKEGECNIQNVNLVVVQNNQLLILKYTRPSLRHRLQNLKCIICAGCIRIKIKRLIWIILEMHKTTGY